MKLRKALKELNSRLKAWEDTIKNGKSPEGAFRKPGSMKGRA